MTASVSATLGSSTRTGWKRRSRAWSFSIYLRYSLKVVAPMTWISPRERAGLRILPAFMAPSLSPAEVMVWISSMNRMMLPAALTSLSRPLTRCSNWPRNWCRPRGWSDPAGRSPYPSGPQGHCPWRFAPRCLGDGRLADARLTDEAGVVLLAAAQDLDGAVDLAVAAHDVVELASRALRVRFSQ